jgi:hypothetical protein
MKKMVWFGFLLVCFAGCSGGTYKSIEGYCPPVSQSSSRLAFKIDSPEGVDQKELENFKELTVFELEKRGFVITPDAERKLVIQVVKLDKESMASRITKRAAFMGYGVPLQNTSSNALVVQVFLEDKGKTTEFKEFQEFKESTKSWEDLKWLVARRIADAVYGAAR